MRILQAAHFLPPSHIAGVEVYTDRVVEELSRQHDVGVLATEIRRSEPNYRLRRYDRGGAKAYEITNNQWFGRFEDTYRDPAMLPVISEVLDEFAPDVVHVQHLMGLSLTLIEALTQRSIPTVMTVHDHWLECAEGGQRFHRDLGRCETLDARRCGACTAHMSAPTLRARAFVDGVLSRRRRVQSVDENGAPETGTKSPPIEWKRRMYRLGARLARVPTSVQARRIESRWRTLREGMIGVDRFLVPSRYLARELVEFGLAADRVVHLDYGFSQQGFRKRHDLPDTPKHFAFLGSLVPHKGVHVLLEAFSKLPPGLRLRVCGTERDAPEYVAELKRRWRHPGIHFLGRIENACVPAFLERVDCLIVPSIWCENAPLVIREAHLAGVPVVASRLGGHIELLEAGGGLLYDADSDEALANTLRRLCDEPGMLAKLAESAPPVKSIETHVTELVEIYRALTPQQRR